MDPKKFFGELKRRNVYRAAVAYGVLAWFLTQLTTQVFPFFEIPNAEIEFLQQLNQVVRSTESFRTAETSGRLIRVPTGDGMALIFFRSPEEPARCALEISQALKSHPHIQLRMGVHSGPVNQTTDVNDRLNVAGAGINVAQRVMDCGDAGHILF